MLEIGIFPDDWKRQKVHPIFKFDERSIPNSYRPISILSAISKIIERVMHTQLLEYFQAGNLLTDSQSGFRQNHPACTALISAVNLWLTNMDAGKLNGSVFIDLKKAFDTGDHKIFPHKLSCYGVNGNALHVVWSDCSKTPADQLQKLQNRAARIITRAVSLVGEVRRGPSYPDPV